MVYHLENYKGYDFFDYCSSLFEKVGTYCLLELG